MTLGSLICIQIGLALSIGLTDRLGTSGAGWIRLAWAGVLMLPVFIRPTRARFTRRALIACVALGVVTVGITLLFQAALALIPMGTASALNFLGPLVLAAIVGSLRRLMWPVLAAAGVLTLWALYIVLTQRVGDEVAGIDGLALSMVVSGLVGTAIVGPGVIPRLTPELILFGLGIAVLCPIAPYVLEFLALRRLTAAAFGTLMALESSSSSSPAPLPPARAPEPNLLLTRRSPEGQLASNPRQRAPRERRQAGVGRSAHLNVGVDVALDQPGFGVQPGSSNPNHARVNVIAMPPNTEINPSSGRELNRWCMLSAVSVARCLEGRCRPGGCGGSAISWH